MSLIAKISVPPQPTKSSSVSRLAGCLMLEKTAAFSAESRAEVARVPESDPMSDRDNFRDNPRIPRSRLTREVVYT